MNVYRLLRRLKYSELLNPSVLRDVSSLRYLNSIPSSSLISLGLLPVRQLSLYLNQKAVEDTSPFFTNRSSFKSNIPCFKGPINLALQS